MKGKQLMALLDYIWLIRLIMEILKLIAEMAPDERAAIAQLRTDLPFQTASRPRKKRNQPADPVEDTQPA